MLAMKAAATGMSESFVREFLHEYSRSKLVTRQWKAREMVRKDLELDSA